MSDGMEQERRWFSETLALAEPFDALFSRGAPCLRVTNPHWRFQAGKVEVAGGAVNRDINPLSRSRAHRFRSCDVRNFERS
jgi:hypothetical protein